MVSADKETKVRVENEIKQAFLLIAVDSAESES